jgi:hypothetical protein
MSALYVESLRGGKTVKYRAPHASAQLKIDVAAATRFWSEHKTAKRVKQAFDIMDKLIGIIESSPGIIVIP